MKQSGNLKRKTRLIAKTPLKRHKMPAMGFDSEGVYKTLKRTGYRAEGNTEPKKKKRKKSTPLALVKKRLWQECRRIQFMRYGDICYTCGRGGLEGSNRQLGHYISSSVCSVAMRYDLDNLKPQCYHCNINLSGNWLAFEAHLMVEFGRDYPTELKQRNEQTKNQMFDILWYEAKLEEYTDILI